jgi:hypothetical protein
MTEQDAAALVRELKERLRQFIGRPLADVRPEIVAEVKAFLTEKEAEVGGREALREPVLGVIHAYLKSIGCSRE